MKLCDYGCGREAKNQFKNGKWCCEKYWKTCPKKREEQSNITKKVWKDPKKRSTIIEAMNHPEVKVKNSKAQKEAQNRPEVKAKQSKSQKERWKKPGAKENYSKISKEIQNRPEVKTKCRITIEKIQKQYKTFSKEEEMRYNPDEPEEKEIQVHCKYSKCKRSKENDDWFTPTKNQFHQRRRALENKDGSGGGYFYCSEECKQKCPLYYFRRDLNTLSEFEKYSKKVWKETNKTVEEFSYKIKKLDLRGTKYGYALDHKYSIYDGFINNINSKIIGCWCNLECITIKENSKKNRNSSITLEELLTQMGVYK